MAVVGIPPGLFRSTRGCLCCTAVPSASVRGAGRKHSTYERPPLRRRKAASVPRPRGPCLAAGRPLLCFCARLFRPLRRRSAVTALPLLRLRRCVAIADVSMGPAVGTCSGYVTVQTRFVADGLGTSMLGWGTCRFLPVSPGRHRSKFPSNRHNLDHPVRNCIELLVVVDWRSEVCICAGRVLAAAAPGFVRRPNRWFRACGKQQAQLTVVRCAAAGPDPLLHVSTRFASASLLRCRCPTVP